MVKNGFRTILEDVNLFREVFKNTRMSSIQPLETQTIQLF